MKLVTLQSSPFTCHFLPHRYKYSSPYSIDKHSQSVFFPHDRHRVSYPYKRTGKISVANNLFYLLILYTFLKGNETQKGREQFLNDKCVYINEEIAYKKIIGCTKNSEI